VKKLEVKEPSKPAADSGGDGVAVDPLTKNREVVKKTLLEGFKLASEESGQPIELAEKIAAELEEELHKKYGPENGKVSKEYKMKYRSLSFNIKDKKNPDLRRRILLGEIPCKDIITWTPHQLASDKRKEDNVEIKKTALLNAQARKPAVSSTDQFKCGKCGKRKCTYYQMQTRSADEPMTTFVTCMNCNNRWKFS
jgi:transcription elongation factor S-II